MKYNILLVGFGVIGVEALSKIVNDYKGKKKLKVIVVDKNIQNVPGGVAYSKQQSKFGFFNNPLRLSNPEFIKWIKKSKNIIKIKKFIYSKKDFNLSGWLKKNEVFNKKDTTKFDEIYLPRLTYSFFLEEKIVNLLKKVKKKNIDLHFIEGEFQDITNNNEYICKIGKNSNSYKFLLNKSSFKLKKINKKHSIHADNIIIGNGLLPPQKIKERIFSNNNNYIWDFYSEGGTQNLLKKISKKMLSKKFIKILFIGNKAGLLETMPEIENFSKKKKNQVKIKCFAPNLLSLEKAELSNNYLSYRFKFLRKENLKKIANAKQIYFLIKKEFNHAKKIGFYKYDVWTLILKKKILNKIYNTLSLSQKKIYNDSIFSKIRNITRYTYPNTINAKNRLEETKVLSYEIDKIIQLNKSSNHMTLITSSGKKFRGDLVVNVSGPVSLSKATNEVKFLKSLKKLCNEFNERGFFADVNFSIGKNIYAPGVISSNFNPNRFTIIKAITLNTHKSVKKIMKSLG